MWNPETNIKGPPGPIGPEGPPGPGIIFKGSVPTAADLPTGASPGDMYITEDTDIQYVWDGAAWVGGTSLTGPPGPQGDPGADSTVPGPVGPQGSSAWADITGKPATFPPTVPIPWTDVSGKPATFPPTLPIGWTDVSGKPSTFPPTLPIPWADVSGKPSTFPPSAHGHPQSEITNLIADLALKAPLASPTFTGDPKAPTPLTADNDTSIATTAFVKANLATIVGGAIVSDTAPGSPQVGQLWYESDSGNTFIWYADADSSQWVQVNVQPAAPVVPAVVGTAQTRNRIVNGAMQISQEWGESVLVAANTNYILDQWRLDFVGPAMQAAQVPYVTLNGSKYVLNANAATPKPSLAAGDYFALTTLIEGVRVADFAYGMASARQSVLRFSVMVAVAGTYTVAVRNSAVDRTWLGTFAIAAGEINTLVTRTLVIPGDTTGTWLKNIGVGLNVSVCYACGTTLQGVAGWQAGNKLGVAGMANAASITGWNIILADVGLYLDLANTGKAPDWTMPDEAEELRACQRYWAAYYNSLTSGYFAAAAGYNLNTTVTFPVRARVVPAVSSLNVVLTNCSAGYNNPGVEGVRLNVVAAAAGTFNFVAQAVIANARM